MRKGGDWFADGGVGEQITAAANYPGGGGGKGQRHWIGARTPAGKRGQSATSGALVLTLEKGQEEFWIRWYTRFQKGFKFKKYMGFKMLYLYDDAPTQQGYAYFMMAKGKDTLQLYTQLGDHRNLGSDKPGCGWMTVYPTGVSDGSWHCYELHLKRETAGKSDGVMEVWLDGRKVITEKTVSFGLADKKSLFKTFVIGSNIWWVDNDQNMYIDFDDIAISGSGYIGPISSKKKDARQPDSSTRKEQP